MCSKCSELMCEHLFHWLSRVFFPVPPDLLFSFSSSYKGIHTFRFQSAGRCSLSNKSKLWQFNCVYRHLCVQNCFINTMQHVFQTRNFVLTLDIVELVCCKHTNTRTKNGLFPALSNRYCVCVYFEKRPLHKFVINSNLSVMEFSECSEATCFCAF